MNVLIATRLDSIARETLEQHKGYVVTQVDAGDLTTLAATYPDVEALIVRSEAVTAEVIDAFPKLQIIVRAGSGYNTIDVRHARAKGIDVMNTPAANSNAVAEEVIALMLADARHIVEADQTTRAGMWEKKRLLGREITGKTIGIVGLGYIGQLVARRLSGFDVRIVAADPLVTTARAEEFGVDLLELEAVFEQADYVTLHIPENDETRGLIGEALLAKMKPGATIINCARAGIIDEDALRRAKGEKGLRFLNDVYAADEPGEKSVADIADLMMPHLGASTVEANRNAARRAAEQLIELTEQGVTSFIVNREIPQGLDEAYCRLANVLAQLCRGLLGKGTTPKAVATSFYGSLHEYADWLLVPIIKGFWDELDRPLDYRSAPELLRRRGMDYISRDVDSRKGYESSITLDLTGTTSTGETRSVSVRGTVAESRIMVSRIDGFDRLYLDPYGITVFFLYKDRPGVLGQIGLALANAAINIEDVRNPHNTKTGFSLATMKVNRCPEASLIDGIAAQIQAQSAFLVSISA
jgi:D-3-phosphoglycerate dehydrogenase